MIGDIPALGLAAWAFVLAAPFIFRRPLARLGTRIEEAVYRKVGGRTKEK